jgi:hypothetical protein
MWKESREVAEWVICCDIDEFLHHPDLLDFLADCRELQSLFPYPRNGNSSANNFQSQTARSMMR